MPGFLVVVIVLALAGAAVWLDVAVVRRNRKKFAAHPEKRPYGRGLLLRALPFGAIGMTVLVWGLVEGDVVRAVLGGATVVAFAVEITRRWNPPTV